VLCLVDWFILGSGNGFDFDDVGGRAVDIQGRRFVNRPVQLFDGPAFECPVSCSGRDVRDFYIGGGPVLDSHPINLLEASEIDWFPDRSLGNRMVDLGVQILLLIVNPASDFFH
jgi:hypothetical protein